MKVLLAPEYLAQVSLLIGHGVQFILIDRVVHVLAPVFAVPTLQLFIILMSIKIYHHL